jgi:hypothetical protein
MVSPVTIVAKAEASAPPKAAILPPPGTGSLPATLSKKSFTVKSANMVFYAFSYQLTGYSIPPLIVMMTQFMPT